MSKKYLYLFFIIFLFFSAKFCFAADLEVQYPTLITGASVTPQTDLPNYLKYVFDFGMLFGFLAVLFSFTWAGVLFFLSPAFPSARAGAKDRVEGAVSGLIILLTCYLIITTINPQLAIFNLTPLKKVEPPPVENSKQPGVYFYKESNCPENNQSTINTSSIKDLGDDLTNQIKSVGIIQDPKNKTYYVSLLYDQINYTGKCQYIDPTKTCNPTQPFAASASVHKYFYNPSGDVVIYRKSFFNKDGGYLRITASEIKKVYVGYLDKLYFGPSKNSESCTVPKDEQDCVKWDKTDKCLERKCPNLTEKNISSIGIEGNYIVVLVYHDPSDSTSFSDPQTYCQEYPSADDVNKNGPQQIKWDAIRNKSQTPDPNFIVIIPVAEK